MALPAYANNQQTFPAMYEQWLVGPLFRPFAEVLLDRLQPRAGERVLDVACGTGIVARLARERVGDGSAVVGVDVSPGMLDVARAVGPAVTWREGSALALPLAAGEVFDVVTCQQGLQFFPDRPAAAGEMRRALAPGGRIGVATWRSAAEVPLFAALQQVAERHLGPVADQRHGFGDGAALAALLRDAGLHDVTVETVTLPAALRRRQRVRAPQRHGAGRHVRHGQGDERGSSRRGGGGDRRRQRRRLALLRGRPAAAFDLSTNLATGRG